MALFQSLAPLGSSHYNNDLLAQARATYIMADQMPMGMVHARKRHALVVGHIDFADHALRTSLGLCLRDRQFARETALPSIQLGPSFFGRAATMDQPELVMRTLAVLNCLVAILGTTATTFQTWSGQSGTS